VINDLGVRSIDMDVGVSGCKPLVGFIGLNNVKGVGIIEKFNGVLFDEYMKDYKIIKIEISRMVFNLLMIDYDNISRSPYCNQFGKDSFRVFDINFEVNDSFEDTKFLVYVELK
jgi:hypothetical protein